MAARFTTHREKFAAKPRGDRTFQNRPLDTAQRPERCVSTRRTATSAPRHRRLGHLLQLLEDRRILEGGGVLHDVLKVLIAAAITS